MISDVRDAKQKEIAEVLKQLDMLTKMTGLPIYPEPKTGNPLWSDVRELDLRYQIPVKRISKFFDELKKGKVLATRCSKCGTVYFPPQDDCPKCRTSNLEWKEIQGEGEILTYTVISVKPPSFAHYPDYVVGIARFGDVNVTAWVDGPREKIKVGSRVKLDVSKREPEGYITYRLILV
ncbi:MULTISPECIES: Zn-ribbon domain-containing OB-fold protein [Metallosphaera]|uniref:Zn-ribbon domain-containing OB-fold protein n=1 Tax=Metallosphaera TaxID=41980 RepID=UPI001F06EBC7|nr:Zn-ribbon domain-containing OB-fold protein [Metallosphaera sedula]MCH1771156.1 Zn-ribbon domain-containing OB-fold protein [Metallosphaera sedula]MCP6729528.1 Zn-ribbon domain-containing OB-fold protein [Metallosphaera sedula]